MELRSDRLTVRPWRNDADDVEDAFGIYGDPEVTRWHAGDGKPWPDLDGARRRLGRWVEFSAAHPGYGEWAVVPHDVGRAVGSGLLAPLRDAEGGLVEDVEVGWDLHPDHRGHGYATEAAGLLLGHAFATMGLEVVHAIAYPDNVASIAVMRRLGMTHHGLTSQWYGQSFDWWSVDRKSFEAGIHR